MRALISRVPDVVQLRMALASFFVPWVSYKAFLDNVKTADKPEGAYQEIQEYINWRRVQPEEVGSRQIPLCIDNETGEEALNWRDEFIRVCTSVGHLWLINEERVCVIGDGGTWPVITFPPWQANLPMPLLWIDYDPWEGTFDVVMHSFRGRMSRVITLTMISLVEIGHQEISRVVVDLDRPGAAREAGSSGKGALTLSATWIRPGEVGERRNRELPLLKTMCGVPGVDFALLLTMSSPRHRVKQRFISLSLCQGFQQRPRDTWTPPKGQHKKQSYAHQCPYFLGEDTPRFKGFRYE